MSLRAQSQEDKRRRILDAAEALFHERGFALTTTREVAQRAGVATGTLFLYVRTKEELLLTLWRERLGAVVEAAWASRPAGGLEAELLHLFSAFFDWYARDPALSRVYVRELLFPGGSAAEAAGFTRAFLERLGARLSRAAAEGELPPATPAALLSANLFGAYLLVLIGWLNGQVGLEAARGLLAASISFQLRGAPPPVGAAPPLPANPEAP